MRHSFWVNIDYVCCNSANGRAGWACEGNPQGWLAYKSAPELQTLRSWILDRGQSPMEAGK